MLSAVNRWGGKAGRTPAPEVILEARETSQDKAFAPLAHDQVAQQVIATKDSIPMQVSQEVTVVPSQI